MPPPLAPRPAESMGLRHRLIAADATAVMVGIWMAFFAQGMFQIALELAENDPAYAELAVKFFERFIWIAASLDRIGDNEDELWDEQDGFFYDLLRLPDGRCQRLRVRSMVGLLPLCASTVISPATLSRIERLRSRLAWVVKERTPLLQTIASSAEHSALLVGFDSGITIGRAT